MGWWVKHAARIQLRPQGPVSIPAPRRRVLMAYGRGLFLFRWESNLWFKTATLRADRQ